MQKTVGLQKLLHHQLALLLSRDETLGNTKPRNKWICGSIGSWMLRRTHVQVDLTLSSWLWSVAKSSKSIRRSSYLVMYIISDSNWGGCSLDFARLRTCEWADRFAQSSGYLRRSTRWSHVPRATRSFHGLQQVHPHLERSQKSVATIRVSSKYVKLLESCWITAMFHKKFNQIFNT